MAAHFPTPTWRSLVAWTVIEYVTKEICRSDPSLAQTCTKHLHITVVKEIASNTELARMPSDVGAPVHSFNCLMPKFRAVSLSLFSIDFSTRYAQVV